MKNKPIHLPYNQYDDYWLCILPHDVLGDQQLANRLLALGFTERQASQPYYLSFAGKDWSALWLRIKEAAPEILNSINIAIVAGKEEPSEAQLTMSHKSAADVDAICDSLWLGVSLLRDQVVCHFQPVMSKDRRVVGHESFARAVSSDGSVIGGGKIVHAARALGIEYALDRYLHVQAIKTFMAGQLHGYLFVNFFPGFIQRPEVYLEGLTEAVKMHNMISKQVVLDFTESEHQHDMGHIKRVTEFCRSKGYAIALDDVESLDNATKLIGDIRPDFVKLSRGVIAKTDGLGNVSLLTNILDVSHKHGALVIAEGVETEENLQLLQTIDIDMFQGFLFSEPVEVKPAD